MSFDNLSQLITARAGSSNAGIVFINSSGPEVRLSYKELYAAALRGLACLQDRGLRPGDELVFQLQDNRTFVIVFWSCILGGIIPVPLKIGQTDDHKRKVFNVWPVLNNPWLVISPGVPQLLERFADGEELSVLFAAMQEKSLPEADILSSERQGTTYNAKGGDLAFIQFSSGSTGQPKGVRLTHNNLLANLEAISTAAAYTPEDSLLSWMPLTHDMGLIGFHLNPLFCDADHYLMDTSLFIRRPALWLDKASEHRVSVLCSPNFGYEYLLRHCDLPGDHNWDLRAVRLIYNGAEPVSAELCRKFLGQLAAFGLDERAVCPVYGLAEGTLAVTISGLADTVAGIEVSMSRLKTGDEPGETDTGTGRVFLVNLGRPVSGCSLRITDGLDNPIAEWIVGHVQITGSSASQGYYNNPEATSQLITADGWLRTGDLGFMKDGCLYITGRAKDILFVNGQNYYPHDLERIAEQVEGIELNKIAFAGFFNNNTGRDESIAFVLHRGQTESFHLLAASVRKHVSVRAGIAIDHVVRVKDIPRTTSGKLQRFRLVEEFLKGTYDGMSAAVDLPAAPPGEELAVTGHLTADPQVQRIRELFSQVLKAPSITADQDFFEAGGNSLKAAELSMLLLKELQTDISMESIYEKRTARKLASVIGPAAGKLYNPIPAAGARESYPATPAQKRMYYAWELDKDGIAYNLPIAFRLEGRIDPDRLERAARQLIVRHDLLRSTFHLGEQLCFTIKEHIDFSLERGSGEAYGWAAWLRHSIRPFDLQQGPLFRIKWWKSNETSSVLFLDFHHIIADGSSIYLFLEELLDNYMGMEPSSRPAAYADYACWETERLSSDSYDRQERYWLDRMEGELPVLDMPADFPRPLLFETRGQKLAFKPGTDTEQLRRFAAEHQCSLHVLFFTLYTVLLSKYTGQEELIVGIPVSGRKHPDVQQTFGLFVNNLAIRSFPVGQRTFRQLLREQKEQMATALNHPDHPFDELAGAIAQRHDAGRNPLFDTMFIYQNMGMPADRPGIKLKRLFLDAGFSKFDLSLEIVEEGNNLLYAFEYASSLFRRQTIARLAKHFDRLTARLLADADRPLSEVSLLAGEEELLRPGPRRIYEDTTIHRLVQRQALRRPDQAAILHGPVSLTYRELDEKADRLARILIGKGIGRDMPVGILLRRSPEMMISILGVLKAGGCYLPVDRNLPATRISWLLSDSDCRLVIADAGDAAASSLPPDIEVLDITGTETMSFPVSAILPQVSPSDLAYIIYTSGTTGNPKGVMVEHRSLVNYCNWAAEHYIKEEEAVFALFTSISFDLTVTSIFPPLITGNKIVTYDDEENEVLIEKIVADNQATILKLTPSHLRLLIQGEWLSSDTATRIRRLIVGGENLPSELAREITQRGNSDIELFNEYGPTEATVGCMIHLFDPHSPYDSVPIGIPAANTRIYILDKYLNPVPAGVRGELYISGEGLARGYRNNPGLSGQRFLKDPFQEGQRMYKTGDTGWLLPEGILAYGGRLDRQVKINGYRIEIADIEIQLKTYEGIPEAVVDAREDKRGQLRLYAWYTHGQTGDIPEPHLRRHLAARLPHYMIPVHFIPVERMPLTRNGKIDMAGLPSPADAPDRNRHRPPANRIEELSVKVWREVLGEKDITVADNFFELGGDSIKAVQIVSRLAAMGISLRTKDILTWHTIEQISLYAVTEESIRYEQGLVSGDAALTAIQSWFFRLGLVNPHYFNHSLALRLRRTIDMELLKTALKRLIEQHDGLRINFNPETNRLFYNDRHAGAEINMETFPAAAFPSAVRSGNFDITRDLLFKVALFGEAGQEQHLSLSAHHLVVDGISWRVLLEDLYVIYSGLEQDENILLPAKTATLRDWEAAWEKEYSSASEKELDDYLDKIRNTDFSLPLDMIPTGWEVRNCRTFSACLSEEDTGFLLRETGLRYKTAFPVILNTALLAALKEWTGQSVFVIEQENHGRHLDQVDVSRTVGWFTALYPVRLEWQDASWEHRLKEVGQQLERIPGKGMTYQKGSQLSGMERQGPAEIRFNYLGQFGKELDNDLFGYVPTIVVTDIDPANPMTAKLEIIALVVRSELHVEIQYNINAHHETTIRRLSDLFLEQLHELRQHLRSTDIARFTPADFELIDLDQADLDSLFG